MFAASLTAITGRFFEFRIILYNSRCVRLQKKEREEPDLDRKRVKGAPGIVERSSLFFFFWRSRLAAIRSDQIQQRQQKSLDSRVIHTVTIKHRSAENVKQQHPASAFGQNRLSAATNRKFRVERAAAKFP